MKDAFRLSPLSGRRYPVLRLPSAILLFSLLFLLVRLALIFHPRDAGWTVMVDELPTGNVALDLETGLVMPFPLYQTKPFAAGTLYEGLLSYPLRALFGPTLFSLKMAAVLWNMAAMAAWMTLAWRWFGRGAALVVGALYALPPPFFALMTITAWGNHCESSLLTALSLLFLFPALARRGHWGTSLSALAAGVLTGLGIYLCYTGIPTLILGLVLILGIGGRSLSKVLPGFLAGVLAGCAPLAWSARYYGLEGLSAIDTYTGYRASAMVQGRRLFLEENLLSSAGKLWDFWTRDLWRSALLPEDFHFRFPSWLNVAIIVSSAFCVVLWRRREAIPALRIFQKKNREDALPFLQLSLVFFPVIFSVIYALSGFRVSPVLESDPANYADYRYLVPVYPFLFAALGLACQDLWCAWRESPIFRALLLAGLALVGVALSDYHRGLGKEFPPSFEVLLYRGDDALHLMDRMAAETSKHRESFGVKVDKIHRLRRLDQGLLFERMSRVSRQGFQKALLLSQNLHEDFRPILYRGLGWGLSERAYRRGAEGRMDAFLSELADQAPTIPARFRPYFLEGVGWGMSFASQEPVVRLVKALSAWDTAPVEWRDSVKRGLGRRIGAGTHIDEALGEPRDESYYVGLGAQLRRNAELQSLRYDPVAESILGIEDERRVGLLKGFVREGREFFL